MQNAAKRVGTIQSTLDAFNAVAPKAQPPLPTLTWKAAWTLMLMGELPLVLDQAQKQA